MCILKQQQGARPWNSFLPRWTKPELRTVSAKAAKAGSWSACSSACARRPLIFRSYHCRGHVLTGHPHPHLAPILAAVDPRQGSLQRLVTPERGTQGRRVDCAGGKEGSWLNSPVLGWSRVACGDRKTAAHISIT